MQSFKPKSNIELSLAFLERKAEEISSFIANKDELEAEDVKQLNLIYLQRKEEFGKVAEHLKKLESQNKSLEYDKEFEKKIKRILEIDKNNLDYINDKFKKIKNNLLDFEKKKNVLIYTKNE